MTIVATSLVAAVCVLLAAIARPRPARVAALCQHPTAVSRRSRKHRPAVRSTAFVLVSALILTAGLLPAAIAGGGVLLAGTWQSARRKQRDAGVLATHYPDFVDLFVLTIRSGCTPIQAFETLGDALDEPLRGAVRDTMHRVRTGQRFAEAVVQLPGLLGSVAQPFADALALSDRYGTPLPPVLDRLADESRAQRRRNAEASARQLPIKLSFPLVGCTLPSFILLTIVPLMAGTLLSFHGSLP